MVPALALGSTQYASTRREQKFAIPLHIWHISALSISHNAAQQVPVPETLVNLSRMFFLRACKRRCQMLEFPNIKGAYVVMCITIVVA